MYTYLSLIPNLLWSVVHYQHTLLPIWHLYIEQILWHYFCMFTLEIAIPMIKLSHF